MLKIKKIKVGFILNVLSLILTLIALFLFLSTYEVFSFQINRWAVTCSILAIWGLLFLTINSLFKGEKQFWTSLIYPIIVVLITYAALQFIKPCLSPIAIFFTVRNMGDTATYEIGVPRAIITAVLYILALILSVVSSFMASTKEGKKNG